MGPPPLSVTIVFPSFSAAERTLHPQLLLQISSKTGRQTDWVLRISNVEIVPEVFLVVCILIFLLMIQLQAATSDYF